MIKRFLNGLKHDFANLKEFRTGNEIESDGV